MMTVLTAFKQVDLFRGLTDEQLLHIEALATREAHTANSLIVNQGDAADKVYIIAAGQVEVSYRTSSGEDISVLFLGEGQVFGEMTLVDDGRRSASVIALADGTVVYSIDNTVLGTLCAENTGIGYIIMRNIAQDLSFKLRHRDFDTT